jgi:serine/threonine-protein kinase
VISEATLLGDRYQLIREIDRGGMGAVWEAQDVRLERRVALKLLHPHLAADPEFRERFYREARSAAALAHPNIVAVYDVVEGRLSRTAEVAQPIIVMELVDGENLKARLRHAGPPAETQVRAIGAALADALDYAHQRGVVHRDVKPQNVLLDVDGRPRLTDFGIAQALATGRVTRTGLVMGSAHYLAPELARGQAGTARSDVYSLGVVLYEMATGRLPFSGDTDLAIALAHVRAHATPTARGPTRHLGRSGAGHPTGVGQIAGEPLWHGGRACPRFAGGCV